MIVLKAAQEKILSTLQSVAGIVERRHTLPILANVLIRKKGPELELITSDLEIQIRTLAQLDGDEGDYAITVGAKKLGDILKSLPSDQVVSLTANQAKLTLQGGKSRFTLQTLPAEDFPLVQEAADFGPTFSVPQAVLKSLIAQVHFAMAVHDIRYYLNGILFVAEGTSLTDGAGEVVVHHVLVNGIVRSARRVLGLEHRLPDLFENFSEEDRFEFLARLADFFGLGRSRRQAGFAEERSGVGVRRGGCGVEVHFSGA